MAEIQAHYRETMLGSILRQWETAEVIKLVQSGEFGDWTLMRRVQEELLYPGARNTLWLQTMWARLIDKWEVDSKVQRPDGTFEVVGSVLESDEDIGYERIPMLKWGRPLPKFREFFNTLSAGPTDHPAP